MNTVSKSEEIVQKPFVLLLVLACLFVGSSAAQEKPKTPPTPPKPSPPRVNISHPSTNKSTTSTTGVKLGTTRPATTRSTTTAGKTGAKVAGKTGTGTVGKNGNGSIERPGATSMKTNTMGGANLGRAGGNGMARTVSRPAPGRQVSLRGGGTANIRPNGQIRSINRNGMHIEHGLNGGRRIESTHNGARIVTTGRNSGYVQRPYVTRNGRSYVSRTVVVNHVAYTHVYRSYAYQGYCCYYGYQPAFYYGPAYYGWAYNPWPAPVYYGWGWGGSPWYGYYGGYFAPYPSYPSAAFWLTDYLIAADLQAAYQAQAAANAAAANNAAANDEAANNAGANNAGANNAPPEQSQPGGGNDAQAANSGTVTLSPEVKEAIAEEVKAQLAADQAQAKAAPSAASQPTTANAEVPAALDPARRTFVVSSDLAVTGDGQECQLTAGDVITRLSDTPDEDRKVTVSVSASKKADCAPGKEVAVGVDDLQEMHNHFEEQLDNGMKELASKQGTNNLPKAPDTTPVASNVPPPPPDASAEKALQDQQAQADQTEAQVVKEAFSQGS